MMVYVLTQDLAYEGGEVRDVFKSLDDAIAAARQIVGGAYPEVEKPHDDVTLVYNPEYEKSTWCSIYEQELR